ncbi:acyl-CoA dehydrogenase family protein [Occultella gossypii]|uniref:Acyl-CoA/acyl-ACP dehydrogenase n=1 Tax=Occultella gossypii TaxID=2800820 RepID=A0ABS7S515_9MICO|nr:acyl-CoA dehydrogenase family protein [Occultella gossypii]MBZ2195439.1 acyl-CoA/acyl-ACP dehydrogenase [Occultella gossypii]
MPQPSTVSPRAAVLTDEPGLAADPIADTAARAALRARVRELVTEVAPPERVLELDEREEFDEVLYRALAADGILAIGADAAYGGSGDIQEQAVVIEELAAGPTSMAVYLIVHYMGVHILSSFGTEEQRRQWLTRLVKGEAKLSFALTEPDGGTDIARVMSTSASQVEGGWVLDGHKRWIGGTNTADFLLVLARTAEPERSSIDGVTMLLVPGQTPGLSPTVLPTASIRGFDTTEIRFEDVHLPASAVVGVAGSGFRQVLSTLNRERINAAAGAIGAARGALDATVSHARDRKAFGSTLGAFQAVQHRLVDGALAIEAARGLLVRAAAIESAGGRADNLSSMAKVAASEAAVKVTQDGMEIFGGMGLSRDLPIQRWWRDVRLWVFAPINNDMLRNNLGERLLGLPRSF